MSMYAFQGAVELGLIYALMALGIFVSYRILDVADLTVDGSFTLGASVSVVCVLEGHPVLALFAGAIAGSLAGIVTAFLQTKLKIQPILAGILVMTGLYSINLRVMGSSNVSLLGEDTVFTWIQELLGEDYGSLVLALVVALVVCILLGLFFNTQLGLSIRATGDNEDMVLASSINANFTKTVGLALANALVGLSGAMLAQYQGFSEATMGIGMVVIGLASLIIGEVIFGNRTVVRNILAVVLGAVIYRIIIALVLETNMAPGDLKLISSLIVAIAISHPTIRGILNQRKLRRKGDRNRA